MLRACGALARAVADAGGARWTAQDVAVRAPSLVAARLLAPPAAALLRPWLAVGAAAAPSARWFASSSSSDGPPPPEEEEEHVVIWPRAPAVVADRQKGDVYHMGGAVKRWDGRTGRAICRECLPERAVQAKFTDEDGKAKQLCATHARAAGTYAVRNPCRDCPEDAKLQAHFKDEDGKAGSKSP